MSVPPDDLPRSPTGRIPQWVIDEAADWSVAPPPWRTPEPPLMGTPQLPPGPPTRATRRRSRAAQRAGRRGSGLSGLLAGLLVLVLVASLAQWAVHQSGGALVALRGLVDGSPVAARPSAPGLAPAPGLRPGVNLPPPGLEEQATPLGRPPAVVADGAPYAFLRLGKVIGGSQRPVAWSPCRPIHVTVNAAGAPARFPGDVAAVLAEASAATGLQFIDDGPTTEPVSTDRAPYLPDLYGDRWAPVLVQFGDVGLLPALAGDVAGVGGATAMSRSDLDYSVYVSGAVVLDSTLLAERDVAGQPAYLAVLRHEMGHVLGLGHVDDPTQLMNPTTSAAVTTYQSGDRRGLALLGSGPCAPDL